MAKVGDAPAAPAPKELGKLERYGSLHWKELLALALAAIPVAVLLFHKPSQTAAKKAASGAITYITAPAAGAGDSAAGGASVDPAGSTTSPLDVLGGSSGPAYANGHGPLTPIAQAPPLVNTGGRFSMVRTPIPQAPPLVNTGGRLRGVPPQAPPMSINGSTGVRGPRVPLKTVVDAPDRAI